ncbi:MAG: acyl--CoA ligase [Mogibacterium sp.]|nr:acyl--CoA ligase [Mogibacterium sp.]
MKKYQTFYKLIEDFDHRPGIALLYADETEESDELRSVSYTELAALIRERADQVRSSGKTVDIVLAEHTIDAVVQIFADVIAGCTVVMADPDQPEDFLEQTAEAARELRRSGGSDLAEGELLFCTSGTTSRSRVVRLTSRSLCTSAWSGQCMLPCGPEDRLLAMLPYSHVFGFVCALLWGLAYGAEIALSRGLRHIADDTLYFRPTILPAVPSLIGLLLRYDLLNPELRVALIGAAPCGPEVVQALRARGIDVYLGYGLTETSSGIAITQDLNEPEVLYPCPGADFRISEDGEVTVVTPCMMTGYLGMEPLPEGARFATGDLGSIDEAGRLHLLGRKKDVLLMPDGTKIYCPEYESDLSRITGAEELAVVRKDGHAVLLAGEGCDIAALRGAVADYNRELPRSQQIYDVIPFPGKLPRTATGKLRRWLLQERFEEGR